MFLLELNERQKELFINVAVHAAHANGVLKDEELKLIEIYSREMDMEVPDMKIKSELEEDLKELKSISTKSQLNKITFEILAICISDQEYSQDEIEFMDILAEIFEVKKFIINKMVDHINQYNYLIEEIIKNLEE